MRKTLAKLPSPAMTVAFLALLAALTGTAVALPGSNTVTQGDLVRNSVGRSEIKTGGVGKSEARANSVGGSEVVANSLGGGDINEGALGTVPSSNVANFANFAGLAGAVNGLSTTGQVTAADGNTATVLNAGPWTLTLNCDLAAGPELLLTNNSAGNDSHFSSDEEDDADLDQGESAEIVDIAGTADEAESEIFSAFGSNGTSRIYGIGMAVGEPDGVFGTPDCVAGASVTL